MAAPRIARGELEGRLGIEHERASVNVGSGGAPGATSQPSIVHVAYPRLHAGLWCLEPCLGSSGTARHHAVDMTCDHAMRCRIRGASAVCARLRLCAASQRIAARQKTSPVRASHTWWVSDGCPWHASRSARYGRRVGSEGTSVQCGDPSSLFRFSASMHVDRAGGVVSMILAHGLTTS